MILLRCIHTLQQQFNGVRSREILMTRLNVSKFHTLPLPTSCHDTMMISYISFHGKKSLFADIISQLVSESRCWSINVENQLINENRLVLWHFDLIKREAQWLLCSIHTIQLANRMKWGSEKWNSNSRQLTAARRKKVHSIQFYSVERNNPHIIRVGPQHTASSKIIFWKLTHVWRH